MKASTSRFGTIEFREDVLLTFPSGIIGFPDSTRYVILDHDRDVPFKWLQSVDEPEVAFVVMDPVLFKPDYRVEIPAEDIPELTARDESDLAMFVILTIPSSDPKSLTANLRAPVIVNRNTRAAKQVILTDELPTRYPLFDRHQQTETSREPVAAAASR
jgi:flagellar assembly factor FliW